MWAHGFRYCFTPLSGCFSPFPHGTGALSVSGEYLGLEGGPPSFPPGFTCPAVLRIPPGARRGFAYGALTLSRRPSHAVPLPRGFLTPEWAVLQPRRGSRSRRFALGPRSLAATRGISVDFSSSGYLDVSVPRVAPVRPMCSGGGRRPWRLRGSPVRKPPDRSPRAAPRGLSQLVASFFGFHCQGIRRVPLTSSRSARSDVRVKTTQVNIHVTVNDAIT